MSRTSLSPERGPDYLGARSGLFMEQIRIIKEMRTAERERGRTGVQIRPRYMAWENVPYALKCIRHVMSCKQL